MIDGRPSSCRRIESQSHDKDGKLVFVCRQRTLIMIMIVITIAASSIEMAEV
jgi:hypothetical protein